MLNKPYSFQHLQRPIFSIPALVLHRWRRVMQPLQMPHGKEIRHVVRLPGPSNSARFLTLRSGRFKLPSAVVPHLSQIKPNYRTLSQHHFPNHSSSPYVKTYHFLLTPVIIHHRYNFVQRWQPNHPVRMSFRRHRHSAKSSSPVGKSSPLSIILTYRHP